MSWPLARRPELLETSVHAVLVVGDPRRDNVKRVASAIGDASVSISFAKQVLRG